MVMTKIKYEKCNLCYDYKIKGEKCWSIKHSSKKNNKRIDLITSILKNFLPIDIINIIFHHLFVDYNKIIFECKKDPRHNLYIWHGIKSYKYDECKRCKDKENALKYININITDVCSVCGEDEDIIERYRGNYYCSNCI